MKIIAIETSCDDTSVAILEITCPTTRQGDYKLEILSNIVSSQVKLHAKYGGVYPSLAKREHQKNLPIVLKKALKTAGNPKVNLVAVTVGPGLEPCLWVGINFAKKLAEKLKVSIVPINHIEAHALANFVGENFKFQVSNFKNIFPAICLVVSGGHTQLILIKGLGKYTSGDIFTSFKYKILGETRDDAAGECFDKTARILGLGYPGGPIIAAAAAKYKAKNNRYKINLPRPMINTKDYDFSFSGLKTAVLYQYQKSRQGRSSLPTTKYKQAMAAEIQQSIVDVLIKKTIKAAKDHKAKSIILGGGVAANEKLREELRRKIEKEIPNTLYLIPDIKFCTDNAVMVGLTAFFNLRKNEIKKIKDWKKITANGNLRIDENYANKYGLRTEKNRK